MTNPLKRLWIRQAETTGVEYDEAVAETNAYMRNNAEAIADLIDETAAQHKDCKQVRCWTCEILSKITEGK